MISEIGIKLSAVDATKTAFDSVGRNLANLQTASASVAGALASIGVGVSVGSLVAMVRHINDGVDALNDLKDATGASIENISALEDVARRSGASFDTVGTALVKLNQALNSAKPGSDTERAIKSIGLSVQELKAMDPAEAFQKIAVNLSGYADDANKARLTQELFGKSLKEVAPLLKDLAESGKLNGTVTTAQAEAAEKLNKQIAGLQKNALDAGRAITAYLVPALSDGVERFMLANKHAGGLLDTLAMYLRLDYGKNVQGNLAQVEQQIAQLEERGTRITHESARKGNDKMLADLRAQAAYLKEYRQTRILADLADADVGDAISRKYLRPKASVGEFAAPPKPKASQESRANEFAGDQDAAKEWAKTLEAANKLREDAIAKAEGLTKAEADLRAYLNSTAATLNEKTNPAMNQMVRSAYEATIELEKLAAARNAVANVIESQQGRTAQAEADARAERERTDAIGMTKEALAELAATRLEEMATAKERTIIAAQEIDLSGELADSIRREAQAYRDRAASIRGGAVKEAAIQSAKDAAAEWQRGWAETDRIARDAFTSWATDGSDAAQKIGETLKKALLSAIYEATLKPVVFQVYAALTGGSTSAGAINAGSMLSNGSTLAGLTGAGGYVGQFASGFSGSAAAAAEMMGGAQLTTAAQMGQFAATAAPYVLAALAVKSLTDYKITPDGGGLTASLTSSGTTTGKVGSFQQFQQSSSGILSGGNTTNRSWAEADQGTTAYIINLAKANTEAGKSYARALGLNADALDNFTKNVEINTSGMDAAAAKQAIDAELMKFANEQIAAAYGGAMDGVAKSGETSSQTLQRLAVDLLAVNGGLDKLGLAMLPVDIEGAKVAAGLVDAFGGLEQASTAFGAYYDKFYSDSEKAAFSTQKLSEQFAALGLKVPGTEAEFKALVSSIDRTSDSGQKLTASVIQLAPAFDQAAQSARAAANNMLAAIQNWGSSSDVRAMQAQLLQKNLADAGLSLSMDQIMGATQSSALDYYKSLDPNSAAAQALLKYQQDIFNFVGGKRAGDQGSSLGGGYSGGGGGAGYSPGEAAADSIASAWQQITDSIWGEVKRIRGLLDGSGEAAFAAAQSRFSIATAMARAGDQAAASQLPELSQNLLALAETNSRTLLELQRTRAQTSGSLSDTASLLSAQFGLTVPRFAGGGVHAGGWAMVGERGPELAYMPPARIYNAADTQSMLSGQGNTAMVDELRALRQEVSRQRDELRAIRLATENTSRITEKSDSIGPAPARASA